MNDDDKKNYEAIVAQQSEKEARELIGKGIISGLLRPGLFGIDILQAYNQGDGGYWQNDGTSHTQASGDYHQGTA